MKELIIYKERQFIDKYRCIDRIKKLVSVRSFQPAGVGLLYCYIDRYNLKTLDIDFIVDRIPLEYENKYILFRYSQEKKMYFYCERGQHWAGNEYGYMSRAAGQYAIEKLAKLAKLGGAGDDLGANLIIKIFRGVKTC